LDYNQIQELWNLGYSDEEILNFFDNCFDIKDIELAREEMELD